MNRPRSSHQHRLLAALVATLLIAACAPLPPGPSPRGSAEWFPSPNFDERKANFVILHHTSDNTADEALRTLTNPARKVSAHYLIGRDGRRVQLVDESRRAWHAGVSYWGGVSDLNSASIGIELDNNGNEPFADAQITALLVLLGEITGRHGIPPANVLGHGDVALRRKDDPSAYFPWQQLAEAGFGLWCDGGNADNGTPIDARLGLQAFGYDVADLDAAIVAFKRHFDPGDPAPAMSPRNLAQLRCLVDRKSGR